MDYVVVDLEATCWDDARSRDQMEVIEIGAVRLTSDLEIDADDEFSRFVQPVVDPTLSDFCTELTSITQADVDGAERFPPVFASFLSWVGESPAWFCSWGAYDVGQLERDCHRHDLVFPEWITARHVNVKREFAAWRGVRPCGMAKALDIAGLPLEGTHHRGIDDARNIARLAQLVFADRPPAATSDESTFGGGG